MFDILEDIVDFGGELLSSGSSSSRKSSNGRSQTQRQYQTRKSNVSNSKNVTTGVGNQSGTVEKTQQPQETSKSNSSMIEKEKLTPAKELLKSLQQLRKEEEKAIDDIQKNGRNIAANVTNYFAPPKSTRVWSVAKKLAGKSKEEKLTETKVIFDEKKAQLFDRTMTPTDLTELWEMFMAVTDIYRQTGLGVKEQEACKILLTKLVETGEYLFIGDGGKMALIDKVKKQYLS